MTTEMLIQPKPTCEVPADIDYDELKRFLLDAPKLAREVGEDGYLALLQSHLDVIAHRRSGLDNTEDREEMARFRSHLLPTLLQSEFGRHCFTQPRGYPGDFITQEMIWLARTEGRGHRYQGNSEAGRIINSVTMNMDNPCANEERIYRLRDYIRANPGRIASIGCGCGIEYWHEFAARIDSLFMLDMDQGALDRAREKMLPEYRAAADFCCDNVLKFILRLPRSEDFGQKKLIYSFGLLDYFDRKSARRIVHSLFRKVASGGLLVVTNAHPSSRTRVWMEYVGNWWLNYKAEHEMLELVDGLQGVAHVNLSKDSLGVYQYLEVRHE